MEVRTVTVVLLSCWGLSHSIEQALATAPKDDIKKHYNIIPEVVDRFVLLAEQDRNILKTILTNQALFYENAIIPTVLLSYNASHDAGDCATAEERSGKFHIRNRRKLLEAKVDAKIDNFLREWAERQTQDELEEYLTGEFWTDRGALYDFVSTKNKGVCDDYEDNKCTAVGALEREARAVMNEVSNCKAQYWPTRL